MKHLPLLFSSFRRHRARTALTALSICVAFLVYGYLAAIRVAFTAGVSLAGADRLVVRHRVSLAQLLPISYRDRIRRIPGVADVAAETWFGGTYQDPKNIFPQMPVDPEALLRIYPEFLLPKEARERWLRTRIGAIVGRKTAQRFGWKPGDHITLTTPIWRKKDGTRAWEFEIVGVFDGATPGTDTTPMFFRYDYFEETRDVAEGWVGWYVVKVADPDRAALIAARIDEEFANSSSETKTETERAFLQSWASQIGDIGKIVTLVLTAVFVTILLVAGNTMAQSVRERTGEWGVLKAIGFTDRQVLGLVLGEALLLTLSGGLGGLALAWWLVARGDPTGGLLAVFYLPGRDLVQGVGWILLLAAASGLPPAWQAMRLRVAEALRRGA